MDFSTCPSSKTAARRIIYSTLRAALQIGITSAIVCSAAAQSVIRTDSSWSRTPTTVQGSASGAVVQGNNGRQYVVPGSVYTVTQGQGRLVGQNLFHSFEHFQLKAGDAAQFTTTSTQISNVISRVTGSSPSSIAGLLLLNAAGQSRPDFYFINPNGVTFGAGAQVDVPAAFFVSTATSINFRDGNAWRMNDGGESSLVQAAPESFGFLGGNAKVTFAQVTRPAEDPFITSRLDVSANAIEIIGSSLSAKTALDGPSFAASPMRFMAAGSTPITLAMVGAPSVAPDGVVRVEDSIIASRGNRHNAEINTRNGFFLRDSSVPRSLQASSLYFDVSGNTQEQSILAIYGANVVFDGAGAFVDTLDLSALVADRAKSLSVSARQLSLQDALIISTAHSSPVKGGGIWIDSQSLAMKNSGIASIANGNADAGDITIQVTSLLTASGNSNDPFGIQTAQFINSEARGSGHGGNITIRAGSITLDSYQNITTTSNGPGAGQHGRIQISVTDDLNMMGHSLIGSFDRQVRFDPSSNGHPYGGVNITAKNASVSDHSAIFTSALVQGGRSGDIDIQLGEDFSSKDGSFIGTSAFTVVLGNEDLGHSAGQVRISARHVMLAGPVEASAFPGSSGSTAGISVHAREKLTLAQGAGLRMTNGAVVKSPSSVFVGSLELITPEIEFTGAAIVSTQSFGNMHAANIHLMPTTNGVGDMKITGNRTQALSVISSSASTIETIGYEWYFGAGREDKKAVGDAGSITVKASNLSLSGVVLNSEALPQSSGRGGAVDISVTGDLLITNKSLVLANTYDKGDAGEVTIRARNLKVDNSVVASVADGKLYDLAVLAPGAGLSIVYPERTNVGNGGNVRIQVDNLLTLTHAASISTDSTASGRAGNLTVTAGSIVLDASDMTSRALSKSSGRTGFLTITARDDITLTNGAALSIRNDASATNLGNITSSRIAVMASNVTLIDSSITAASTGNIDASSIDIRFADRMTLDPSIISTSARHGNGGEISISGGRIIILDSSQITTSAGEAGVGGGNGGNIRLQSAALIMNSGFVQANTTGLGASGGNVFIEVLTLLTSGGELLLGGSSPISFQPGSFGINVIQAAAPGGTFGNIRVLGPTVDLAGNLKELRSDVLANLALKRDLCGTSFGSTFTALGRGGLRPSVAGLMRPEDWHARLTDPIMDHIAIASLDTLPESGALLPSALLSEGALLKHCF